MAKAYKDMHIKINITDNLCVEVNLAKDITDLLMAKIIKVHFTMGIAMGMGYSI